MAFSEVNTEIAAFIVAYFAAKNKATRQRIETFLGKNVSALKHYENAQLKAASKAVQVQQDNERISVLRTQLAQSERLSQSGGRHSIII